MLPPVVPPVLPTVPPVPKGWHTPFIHSLPGSHSVLLMHPLEPSLLLVRTQPLTNRTPALKPQRRTRRLTDVERALVISRRNLAHGGHDAARAQRDSKREGGAGQAQVRRENCGNAGLDVEPVSAAPVGLEGM